MSFNDLKSRAALITISLFLSLHALAQPNIIMINWIDPLCNGGNNGSITLIASGVAPITYSIDGGTTFLGDGMFVGLSSGTYGIVIQDGLGLQAISSVTLTEPPLINITANSIVNETCTGNNGLVDIDIANATAPYAVMWNGPAGFTSSSIDLSGIQSGAYNVTVIDALGCSRTVTYNINLTNTVNASFSATPNSGSAPLDVAFNNTSTGAATYSWDFGDGNGSLATNPSNIYIDKGTYMVELVGYNGVCTDTAWQVITVTAPAFEVPNVFTPNQDGINDVFAVNGSDLAEISAIIYNRFGELVYTWSGINGSWDGYTAPAGVQVPAGTYYYTVKAIDLNGTPYEQSGSVALLR